MPAKRRPRLVVILSARETLRGLEAALRSMGLGARRVVAIRLEPVASKVARGRRRPSRAPDAVLVTSRHAVGPLLRFWTRPRGAGPRPELWASGPGTAARLRQLGYSSVRRGAGLGAEGIARALGPPARRLVHLRSDLAGPSLARALRARGHRVTEVIAYRVRPDPSAVRRCATGVLGAAAIVLTSPSATASLRTGLGRAAVRRIGRSTPAVVLGDRTARAARAAGFRTVAIAPTTDPQRFARVLLRAVDDAST